MLGLECANMVVVHETAMRGRNDDILAQSYALRGQLYMGLREPQLLLLAII